MKIGVVGGGTAGWISAIIIKTKYPECNVTLIEDELQGTIGVGESTTVAFTEFLKQCIPDWTTFFNETSSMPKLTKRFLNWDGVGSDFYCPIDGSITQTEEIDHFTYLLLKENKDPSLSSLSRNFNKNKILDIGLDGNIFLPLPACHLEVLKTSVFLRNKGREKGIEHIDAKIKDIKREEKTNDVLSVSYEHNITNEEDQLQADFWIDASGFHRILSQDVPFISFSKYLPVNKSISTVIVRDGDYHSTTTSTAASSGWIWDIPTLNKRGVGYVYCDKYQSKEEAQLELEKYIGYRVSEYRHHKFESGMLKNTWNNNVLSVGLCGSFLEPLQATSIHTTVTQISIFASQCLRSTYEEMNKPMTRKIFNKYVSDMIIDFRNLVNLSYSGKGLGTDFWKDITITDEGKQLIQLSKERLITKFDFKNYEGAAGLGIWMTILSGLNHIPKKVIEEYEKIEPNWYEYAKKEYNQVQDKFSKIIPDRMTNNDFASMIR